MPQDQPSDADATRLSRLNPRAGRPRQQAGLPGGVRGAWAAQQGEAGTSSSSTLLVQQQQRPVQTQSDCQRPDCQRPDSIGRHKGWQRREVGAIIQDKRDERQRERERDTAFLPTNHRLPWLALLLGVVVCPITFSRVVYTCNVGCKCTMLPAIHTYRASILQLKGLFAALRVNYRLTIEQSSARLAGIAVARPAGPPYM